MAASTSPRAKTVYNVKDGHQFKQENVHLLGWINCAGGHVIELNLHLLRPISDAELMYSQLILIWSGVELISAFVLFMLLMAVADKNREIAKESATKRIVS